MAMAPITTTPTVIITNDINDPNEYASTNLLHNLGLHWNASNTSPGADLLDHYWGTYRRLATDAARQHGYRVATADIPSFCELHDLTIAELGPYYVDITTVIDLPALARQAAATTTDWWTSNDSPNGDLHAEDDTLIGPATRQQRDASLAAEAGDTGIITITDDGNVIPAGTNPHTPTRRVYVR